MRHSELGHQGLRLAECQPVDTTFLDLYQQNAHQQIKWDNDRPGGTIHNKPPRDYMLAGILEELDEMTIDVDRVETGYSRLGALVMFDGNDALSPGDVTGTAIERHLKEFGDVSWYLANYLYLYGIDFSRTIPVGKAAWELDHLSQPRSSATFSDSIERAFPWVSLLSATGEVKQTAQAIVGIPKDQRILPEQALLIASGKLVTAMIHIARTRFSVTYQNILEGNKQKLEKRLEDGTIFQKSGGDDR